MEPTIPRWVAQAVKQSGIESLGDFLDSYDDPDFPDRVRALPHDVLAAIVIVTAQVLWARAQRRPTHT